MRIFLSYRRSDTKATAARLADKLCTIPSVKDVFLDVTNIEPGAAFPERLQQAIQDADVLLVIMGENWIGAPSKDYESRIFDSKDFVRLEVTSALDQKKLVIPLLIDGASMPAISELPPDLEQLPHLNALFLRHESFNQDIEVILNKLLARGSERKMNVVRSRLALNFLAKSMLGLIIGVLITIILLLIHHLFSGGASLQRTLGTVEGVILFFISMFLGGQTVAFWLLRRRSAPEKQC